MPTPPTPPAITGLVPDEALDAPAARPFIKWVGGKRQLVPELLSRITAGAAPIHTYHEPFLGGGALFFALRQGMQASKSYRLTDINADLITTYCAVRDEVESLIPALEAHAKVHGAEHYYEVRATKPKGGVALAAWFIYLNKTGFNGLYRVNRSGKFNVPLGSYANPTICDAPGLRAAGRALASVSTENAPFDSVLDRAMPGDLVYFDPPYVPVSATASFTSYSEAGFGPTDQKRLADVFRELDRKGVRTLLSNSGSPEVAKLYAGYRTDGVQARRAVNSRADRRGNVTEYIVQNF